MTELAGGPIFGVMEMLSAIVVAAAAIVMAVSVRALARWPRRSPPPLPEPIIDDVPRRYRVLVPPNRVFYEGNDRQAAKIVRADLREVWKVDARLEVDGVDRG